ncbi:MAG TPA: hypothetical protein VHN98_10030 [Acidimicrobiales bacterium]|nr:hypothetical protein [Acidimicrobiales bacterium]
MHDQRHDPIPPAVLAALWADCDADSRRADIARARRSAAERAFDDDDVVDVIALRLLAFSDDLA